MKNAVVAPSVSRVRAGQPDALFRAAADQAPQIMWIVNDKGAVTYLNHAWYELVGGMPPKWYGHEWGEIVDADDLARMRDQWKAVSANGTVFEGRRRVKARDGRWHTLAYKATPVFDTNGLACWVGMDADVTDMVEAQAALRVANTELESFSHTVSHDLKSPLITVKGFTHGLQRLLKDHPDSRVNHYLDRIGHAVDHMGHLLDGLKVLAHVAGSPLQIGDVKLSAMAQEIADSLARRNPQRQVAVSIQPRLMVRADARLLAVLLENLLGNAWKFTSKVANARIEMGLARHTAGESVFYVRDNGAGFDPAYAARLFLPFERLHSATDYPGTGIGLATVHRVAARHDGRVWAESAPGEGATFWFALPRYTMRESRP
jgi:PAS domain S-box-containing protein